jgi:hypothetical protein
MTRDVEAVLIVGAAGLAAFGTTLVNSPDGRGRRPGGSHVPHRVIAFGGFHLAVRAFAPDASTSLMPPAALVTMFGLVEIYRLNPVRAGLQRWWLLIARSTRGRCPRLAAAGPGPRPPPLPQHHPRRRGGLLLTPMLPSDWALPVRGLTINGSRLWIEIDLGFTTSTSSRASWPRWHSSSSSPGTWPTDELR